MNPTKDMWAILKGEGIELDKSEAAALGGPPGETISVWAAMSARHGSLFAHIVCLTLYLVQIRHCRDQIANVPMKNQNYVRAILLLMLFAPFCFLIGIARKL